MNLTLKKALFRSSLFLSVLAFVILIVLYLPYMWFPCSHLRLGDIKTCHNVEFNSHYQIGPKTLQSKGQLKIFKVGHPASILKPKITKLFAVFWGTNESKSLTILWSWIVQVLKGDSKKIKFETVFLDNFGPNPLTFRGIGGM